jgi:NDP-sugar pyrophosphorylase family protein
MKAVILAGGLGTRLAPFTKFIPKPLLPVGEKSVLEWQILQLSPFGIQEIFVATNYMADYVSSFLGDGSRYGVKLIFSREEKPLGTCGPLTLLKSELTEMFLVMNGDILTTLDIAAAGEFATRLDADLTVITKEIVTPFHFGKVIGNGDYIDAVQEKPDITFEILAGIYLMRPAVFDIIPDDTYYGIDTLIKDMFTRNRRVGKYLCHGYWLDIGQLHDYEAAQKDIGNHFKHLC